MKEEQKLFLFYGLKLFFAIVNSFIDSEIETIKTKENIKKQEKQPENNNKKQKRDKE